MLNIFYDCSGLTSVALRMKYIGKKILDMCPYISSITILDGETSIEDEAFKDRTRLTSVTLSESVTSIGKRAFSGCSNLASITIPNSMAVTSIEEETFYCCSNLTSITIPESVTSIGEKAFMGCSSLTAITIPESVTSIEQEAFNGCSSLTSITIPNSVMNMGIWAFMDCRGLTSVTIPESVTSIGVGAFSRCSGLTSITIPNSLTSIGESVFSGCTGLKSVSIGNSVTSIGEYAFCGTSLNSFIIPNSVTSIGMSAFQNCSNLSSITIPNSVTSIGKDAFSNCKKLTSATIGMKSVGKKIFEICPNVTNVTIIDGETSIGNGAFTNCSKLISITIPNSVRSIGGSAFKDCKGLTSVSIGNSVTSIGSSAFYGCIGMTSITIPNSVTSIGSSAFYGCSGLTSVTIGNSVTSIGGSAFYGCKGLTSVSIGNSVTSIGNSAFCDCSNLSSIKIPNSVISIGKDAFSGTKWYDNQPDGLVYAGPVLYKYKGTMPAHTKIIIKNGTKGIADDAFVYGDRWGYYSDLTSITIPNSVINIGMYAFYGCSGLTSVSIGNSVTSIGDGAFYRCESLTSVIIPNSVTTIGSEAFKNCSGLTSITSEAIIPPSLGLSCFYYVSESIPVYVPANSVAKYKTANGWKEFVNFREIPDNQKIADAVIAKITAIGNVEYTDACKGKIDAANKAYNALTADQKALVTNLGVLTKAQQTYETLKVAAEKLARDKAKADAVIAKITAIGEVEYTDACKGKIDAANKAYNALTADQKALVINLDVLTKAQQTYDNLKAAAEKLAADKAKADAVIAKITSIGKVEYTNVCKGKIDAANKAYNALTADQKALVTNLDVLNKAQQTYDNLKAAAEKLAEDKAKADAVIAKITAIGKVEYTDACKGKIDAANKAYNALTADQKAFVTNLNVLNKAQQTYETLKAAAEKLIADKAAFDKYKSEIVAIIEALVKDDDSDAVKEIIRKAISDIESLEYEEAISIYDNKAKVQSFVTSVNEAVENQRAENQKTNGIEELEFAEKVNIYDLNGRKITNSMLKSGLYIRNGKKIVIK